ncbi:cysteine peptidase family C39 domain-containing protein [Mycoplasma iguanae]|uniref:Cysteine peptidase family C39 domain-containing protein n=1 Tax=Mycoplasma iguanae TaxID=292461 RepID=A0ABY5RBE8_9MOLU|nr:cysteine peptidase family C39 domain-containing protein [Mycoplasma iguanae]UVD81930.1 cysteine peptidase family C39 domain-containing protein [Mycoplasma iguanae]
MTIKKQSDIKDCGIAVIQWFYEFFFHQNINVNEIKKMAFYSNNGISISNLEKLALNCGFSLNSFKGNFEALKNLNLDQPIIALTNIQSSNHYVIVYKITSKFFYILDPVTGKKKIKSEDFTNMFLNVILVAEKNAQFKPKIKKLNFFVIILSNLSLKFSFLIIVINFINIFLRIFSSFYMRIIFDLVIPQHSSRLLFEIFSIFLVVVLLQALSNFLKSYFLKNLNLKIEKKLFDVYLDSLKSISNHQINKVQKQDHLKRIMLIENVANFIANFTYTIFFEFIIFFFSLIMIVWINGWIFLIIFINSFLLIMISFLYQKKLMNKYPEIYQISLRHFSNSNDLVQNIDKLKNSNFQSFVVNNFYKTYTKKQNLEIKTFHLDNCYFLVKGLINILSPLIIIFVGVLMYFDNMISVGSILLFLSFINFYFNPLETFTDLILNYPIIKSNYQNLDFIISSDKEEDKNTLILNEKIRKLDFQNFNFSYDNNLNIFHFDNLIIDSNIYLTGNNGKGKSTFLQVLAQKLDPKGKMLINDISSKKFSRKKLRDEIFHISSDENFINTNIFTFITENNIEYQHCFLINYQKYQLNKILEKLNLNFNMEIENNGNNFSSGQKQVISLLKIFNKKYKLILIDEAFENIDLASCKLLQKAIIQFQKDALFIEVSHNQKYFFAEKELKITND